MPNELFVNFIEKKKDENDRDVFWFSANIEGYPPEHFKFCLDEKGALVSGSDGFCTELSENTRQTLHNLAYIKRLGNWKG